MTAAFLSPRVPVVDPKTGLCTRDWYLLFSSLFASSGTPNGRPPSISNLVADIVALSEREAELETATGSVPPPLPSIVIVDDLTPPAVPVFYSADDVIPIIGALRDEIDALNKRINDILQGTAIL